MRVNDLIPISSGLASLGIDMTQGGAFDFTTLKPFNRFHTLSGVYHDPLLGESGVLRYSKAAGAFQVSVDGGLTFNNVATAGGTVTSVGVLGDANLTGNVDLASATSGFLAITDTGDASPIMFAVNHLALSGLWGFPTNGFNSLPHAFAEDKSAATTWTVTHNLNSTDVVVKTYDNGTPKIEIVPDEVTVTDANTVTIRWNVAQAGRVVVIAAY